MTEASSFARPVRAMSKSGLVRWFYPAAGLLLLALTLVGFRMFYFEGRSHPGREIPPPIKALIIVHGLAMSLWIMLFAIQPFLIMVRKHKVHMAAGRAGTVLAAILVATGLFVGVRSAQVTPADAVISGFSPKQFMAVPVMTILAFGAFVAIGVWKRRKPAVHRACMFLGTLAATGAAVSRIDPLTSLYAGTVFERLFGPFFMTVVIGAVLVALRCALTRSAERPLIIGMVSLTLVWGVTIAVAQTGAWDGFASIFVN